MGTVNPIIIKTLKKYVEENTDIPKDLPKLLEKLLAIENTETFKEKEGIEKLYEQVLQQFQSNPELVKWSEKYVKDE